MGRIGEQSLSGGLARQITDFKGELIRDFDWSHDGKQLVVARGHLKSNVVVISNFHQRLVNSLMLIDTASERAGAEYHSLEFGNFGLLGAAL